MKEGSDEVLAAAAEALEGVEPFEPAAIEAALAPLLDRFDLKPGKLYQPLRVAITGTSISPGIFESLAALGKGHSVERIRAAATRLAAS
jgi:glutamyl-tRNA synthetase